MHERSAQIPRTGPVALRVLLFLAGGVLVAGCAGPVKVTSDWQGDQATGQSFERVLVVGVSPDHNTRCAFERFLANETRGQKPLMIPSCNEMKSDEELNLENVKRVVAAVKADGVLATSLVAAKTEAREGGTLETQGDAYYKATGYGYARPYYGGGYGVYGIPVVYGEFKTAPPITTVEGEVEILTRLFETRGPSQVYEMTTNARDLDSRIDGLAEVTTSMADRLRKDGILR